MIAANHLRGDLPLANWAALAGNGAEIVDVRDADEFAAGHIPARSTCRSTRSVSGLGEVWLYCGVGQRAYYATRTLLQHGYKVRNLPGGWRTYLDLIAAKP
jgi:rhodanese-related sulfurtransferase